MFSVATNAWYQRYRSVEPLVEWLLSESPEGSKLPLLDNWRIAPLSPSSFATLRPVPVGRRFLLKRKVNLKPLSIVLATLVASTAAWADIVWRGNFETGARSQMSGAEMMSADRLQVVVATGRHGRYALKALVRQFDIPILAIGIRTVIVNTQHHNF